MEIKCQLDATEVFIADLIACSACFRHHYAHHQESIIQWLLPVVFRAVVFKLLVWCGAEGYVSGLQDACLFTSKHPANILRPRTLLLDCVYREIGLQDDLLLTDGGVSINISCNTEGWLPSVGYLCFCATSILESGISKCVML